jgi:hypothetical protein
MGALGLGVTAAGRGEMNFGFGGTWRAGAGTSAIGASTAGASEPAAPATGGGSDAEVAGASPRSMESSRRVSRSIALTANQDDNELTSTVRWSASGEPATNS